MNRVRAWWQKWLAPLEAPVDWPLGQLEWEQAGQQYREVVDEAHQADKEDAAEKGLVLGLQLAQQYVLAQRRAYPEGRSPATDVSRETCDEIHRMLVSVEADAKLRHERWSAERTARLAARAE